jgi:histone acetyltransferase
MKATYPVSHDISKLSHEALSLKIARHSPCTACGTCSGLHPAPDTELTTDDLSPAELFGGLEDDLFNEVLGLDAPYLNSCACGHGIADHGASESELGREEFMRKGRVAIRLDELLQVCITCALRLPCTDRLVRCASFTRLMLLSQSDMH